MADIDQIQVGSTTYDIKDSTARSGLAQKADTSSLGNFAGSNYTISNTDLTDGVSALTEGDFYFYYE